MFGKQWTLIKHWITLVHYIVRLLIVYCVICLIYIITVERMRHGSLTAPAVTTQAEVHHQSVYIRSSSLEEKRCTTTTLPHISRAFPLSPRRHTTESSLPLRTSRGHSPERTDDEEEEVASDDPACVHLLGRVYKDIYQYWWFGGVNYSKGTCLYWKKNTNIM